MSERCIIRYVNNKFDRRITPYQIEAEYMYSMEERRLAVPSEDDFINFLEDFGKHKLARSGRKTAKQLFERFEFKDEAIEEYKMWKEFEEYLEKIDYAGMMFRLGRDAVK